MPTSSAYPFLAQTNPRWELFTELPRETVRKVSTGSDLKPHKSMNWSKKPNLGASGTKNVGFSGYSRPLSDSFTMNILGNPYSLFRMLMR